MKKLFSYLVLAAGLLSACSDFTEITPKGKNILDRVDDLDLLLNFDFSTNGSVKVGTEAAQITAEDAFAFQELSILVNDTYLRATTNIPNLISSPEISLQKVLLMADETSDRAMLTTSDIKYEKFYFIINNVANIVIRNADTAEGDRAKAQQLKAEAYVLRAYFHYWLANLYAKAYDPATAATDGGIPYVKEDNRIAVANEKSSVAEVYQYILEDLDAAFSLNALPNTAINAMRVGKVFAYAVKARVLLSMRDYAGALAAAEASLAINDYVLDHTEFLTTGFSHPAMTCPEDLFYATDTGTPLFAVPSNEVITNYEGGNIIHRHIRPYYPGAKPVRPLNPLSGISSWIWFNNPVTFYVNRGGLTTIDMYLTKAECLLRTGRVNDAIAIVNMIRKKRNADIAEISDASGVAIPEWKYTDVTASTEAEGMVHLKRLCRTEYLYTGKNYLNLKRWNTESAYKETISKSIKYTESGTGNQITLNYTLTPESPLWIFPFPQNATSYNPHLTQNY